MTNPQPKQYLGLKSKKLPIVKPMQSQQFPIVINNKNKITIVDGLQAKKLFLKKLPGPGAPCYREDKIFEGSDFLLGDSQTKVILINRLNLTNHSSMTVAKYVNISDNRVVKEKTSERVTKLIGQSNYDTVFSALCSVINQELKVKGIMSLLTEKAEKKFIDKDCQTDVNCMDLIYKFKQRKRVRRTQLTPYVVKDIPPEKKRALSFPETTIEDTEAGITFEITEKTDVEMRKNIEDAILPVIEPFMDDSNCSFSSLGNLSTLSGLTNPIDIFRNIDQCTETTNLQARDGSKTSHFQESQPGCSQMSQRSSNVDQRNATVSQTTTSASGSGKDSQQKHQLDPTCIKLPDGTRINVPFKPEDHFHIATPEILRNVTMIERKQLQLHQALIDWKLCLHPDEDGNLPIHIAVMNNDVEMLKRQCLVLKNRKESVDIPAHNLTALQMSIYQNSVECTNLLLSHGADPLQRDEEQRTATHLAADTAPQQLQAIFTHARENARRILEEHDLLKPEMSNWTGEELAYFLLHHMCTMVDNQGYTPLMLASKMGAQKSVKLLLEAAPRAVNVQTPNSGNTALYLAIGAACQDSTSRGNKSKIFDNFKETITLLLTYGAEIMIKNHANVDVNDLLAEFNIPELFKLLSTVVHTNKFGNLPRNFSNYMLVKEQEKTRLTDISYAVQRTYKKPIKTKDSVTKTSADDIKTNLDTKNLKTYNKPKETSIKITEIKTLEEETVTDQNNDNIPVTVTNPEFLDDKDVLNTIKKRNFVISFDDDHKESLNSVTDSDVTKPSFSKNALSGVKIESETSDEINVGNDFVIVYEKDNVIFDQSEKTQICKVEHEKNSDKSFTSNEVQNT